MEEAMFFRKKILLTLGILSLTILTPIVVNQSSYAYSEFSINKSSTITVGTLLNYWLSYERILPNGDVLGIIGSCRVIFFNQTNNTSLEATFEVLVNLFWIEGRQLVNFTLDRESRLLSLFFQEGDIIDTILYYFGNGGYFFNPLHITAGFLNNKSDVTIWSFVASYKDDRKMVWNYRTIDIIDYSFQGNSRTELRFNASYELATGILISAHCYFPQSEGQEMIHNILYVTLESSTIQFQGSKDYSSLIFFLIFVVLVIIIPTGISILWMIRRSKML
jgi:hypothetical protein